METHPDRGGDAQEFQEVHKAYKILSDDAKKAKYDQTGYIGDDTPDNSTNAIMAILSTAFAKVMAELVGQGKARVQPMKTWWAGCGIISKVRTDSIRKPSSPA